MNVLKLQKSVFNIGFLTTFIFLTNLGIFMLLGLFNVDYNNDEVCYKSFTGSTCEPKDDFHLRIAIIFPAPFLLAFLSIGMRKRILEELQREIIQESSSHNSANV